MRAFREREAAQRADRSQRESRERPAAIPQSPMLAARGLSLDGLGNRAMLALLRSGRLRRKARVSEPSDALEQSADRAADLVTAGARVEPRMHLSGQGPDIQRMATADQKLAEEIGLGGKTDAVPAAPETVDDMDVSGGDLLTPLTGGRTLDESTRAMMETRFGESFSEVRFHSGVRAAEAAAAVHARAFTVGEDIVFGQGEFAPETTEGRRLIAHELAHVVQQRRPVAGSLPTHAQAERDAGEAARAVVNGATPNVRERAEPGSVQKQEEENWETGPGSYVGGNSIFVLESPMAFVVGSPKKLTIEGRSWDRTKRIYVVSVSVDTLDRIRWQDYEQGQRTAARHRFVVVITYKDPFSGRTLSHTVGAPAPAKPPAPKPKTQQPPPPPESSGPFEEPQEEHPEKGHVETAPAAVDRTSSVEQRSGRDPQGALKEAGDLSNRELNSLGSEPRKALLNAVPDASVGSTPPGLAHDLITSTPDRDAGALSDALQADGGRLLNGLKRNELDPSAAAALDDAAGDLESRRLGASPPEGGHDFVDWTPGLAKKADEVRDALRKIGRRPPGLDENLSGRPEWDRLKERQDADLQRELRNLDRDIASQLDPSGGPSALGGDAMSSIAAAAHDEVRKALEPARAATTVRELFEARKAARMALWRANQAVDDQRALKQFLSAVASWNQTQSGLAALASVPSHALAGVSADIPDQIAVEARAGVERGLAQLRDAKTPEEMSRAATALKQTIVDANFALSRHQDEVYVGGERTVTGIKVVAVTSAAVVAPEYVIPGFFFGGALGAARQEVQISEGSRPERSGAEIFDNAVYGGFAAPFAVGIPAVPYALSGVGLYNAAGEFSKGHGWTGAFDVGTAALPFVAKGAPEIGRWARPRAFALSLRFGTGAYEGGLGGRLPPGSIPNEPSAMLVVDAAGRPIGRMNLEPGAIAPLEVAPPEPPSNAPSQSPGAWQTVQVSNQALPQYQIPFTVTLLAPTPAAVLQGLESRGARSPARASGSAQAAIQEGVSMGFLDPRLAAPGANVATASAQTARSITTGIRAQTAEVTGYDARRARGEIGLFAPVGSNVPGPDYITAARLPNGNYEIVVADTKSRVSATSAFGQVRATLPPTWQNAVTDSLAAGRLDLGDPVLEQAIRDAWAAGRVRIARDTVDYSPQGQGQLRLDN
jgi:hypothetical protein